MFLTTKLNKINFSLLLLFKIKATKKYETNLNVNRIELRMPDASICPNKKP